MITELRRYRIKPERIDAWVDFFAEAAAENARLGIRVEYAGVDRETGTFVWLRSFEDEQARRSQKDAFYGGEWWLSREAWAMDNVIEYDVTFLDAAIVRAGDELLRPRWPAGGAAAGSTGDQPPDGWHQSPRATFVRDP